MRTSIETSINPTGPSGNPTGPSSQRGTTPARRFLGALQLLALLLAAALLVAPPAAADDCARDPNNLRDCLRTKTAAGNIAGTTAVIVVIVVNGVEVGRVLFPPKEEGETTEGGESEEKKEPRQFYLQIETRDDQGQMRTTLDADVEDQITVYARCLEVGKGLAADATESIQFSLTPSTVWVEVGEAPSAGGAKAIGVRTTKPELRGTPPASVTVDVSATIEEQTVTGSVGISLTKRKLRVEVLDALASNPLPIVHERAERVGLRFSLLDRNGGSSAAPRGGLTFGLGFEDRSRSPVLESEDEIVFEEGQSTKDYDYVEFTGEDPRNGGGLVIFRASDEDGRPVGIESAPDLRMKNDARFFIIAPLSVSGVRVAVDRVAGTQATDRVEKQDHFVVEMKDLDDVVADTEG